MKGQTNPMPTKVSALTARNQFGQILRRVNEKRERFLVDRRGEPQAVVMSFADFLDLAAPPPRVLEEIWAAARKSGADQLTARQIDAEISAARGERRAGGRRSRQGR
ncbi:MAG: type II toxin-antitoxin system Phd/YefM family antitoxin [Acidobacteriota bacterium]|jgi:prevent-host-death family protein